MTGAESLLRTLVAGGVEVCFMNPGTSEMQFVGALDRVPEMRGILCLHETVCAGAADGYARMLGKPAGILLHLGPGLANGISNLHNARKARSAVVNIVGEHATHHLAYDAPLTADIEALAHPVSSWVRKPASAAEIAPLAAECIAAAYGPPGGVSTLIIPADHSWTETTGAAVAVQPPARRPVDRARMAAVRTALRQPGTGLLLSGVALQEKGLRAAGRLASAYGVAVFANRYASRLTRGRGVFEARRLPYFPEPAWQLLAGMRSIITVEAGPPISFFGYPGLRSALAPENCTFLTLADECEDAVQALEDLAHGLPDDGCTEYDPPPSPHLDDALTPDSLGQSLAALLPEGSIVADEMVSSGEAVNAWLARAAKHDLLPVTGGSIGQGLPVAVGAAVACPDRYVIALEADGSAMYSMQSLWTMARERLDVVVVIFANRRYRILEVEMQRTGSGRLGPRADTLMDLHNPVIDWVALGRGMGVRSRLATTVQEFRDAFCEGLKYGGPCLIEAVLPSAPES